jgi:hypothetical protein
MNNQLYRLYVLDCPAVRLEAFYDAFMDAYGIDGLDDRMNQIAIDQAFEIETNGYGCVWEASLESCLETEQVFRRYGHETIVTNDPCSISWSYEKEKAREFCDYYYGDISNLPLYQMYRTRVSGYDEDHKYLEIMARYNDPYSADPKKILMQTHFFVHGTRKTCEKVRMHLSALDPKLSIIVEPVSDCEIPQDSELYRLDDILNDL